MGSPYGAAPEGHLSNPQGPEEAPLTTYAVQLDDGTLILLSSSFYIVFGSAGLDPRALMAFRMALDTGCGHKLVNRHVLPEGYKDHVRPYESLDWCDANGRRLTLQRPITVVR